MLLKKNPEYGAARLLARIIRELSAAERFETYADLVDALKFRLARLHIPWTNDAIADALRLVESNTPVVHTQTAPRRELVERPLEPKATRDQARDEAIVALKRIHMRVGDVGGLRVMPPALRRESPRVADARAAFAMIADEIAATSARCDALEREPQ